MSTRKELRAQLRARREELRHQLEDARHQFEETSELIEARTGRNLIAAIAIGLALGLAMLFSLILVKELFLILAAVVVVFATFELATALRSGGFRVPRLPSILAGVVTVPAAFYFDDIGKWWAFLGGVAFVVLWRLVEQAIPSVRAAHRNLWSDLAASVFVQAYVPFLVGFTVLLTAKDGGQWWTLAFIIVVITADTAAYATGLTLGRHPMAPRISPKKTWEGFAGAWAASLAAGVLLSIFMIGEAWWFGLIFGTLLFLSATCGDLIESLIKRDLGIKDMSSWLPGHGGFLDRLDSILPSGAIAYLLYTVVA